MMTGKRIGIPKIKMKKKKEATCGLSKSLAKRLRGEKEMTREGGRTRVCSS
jgi:hypothetical protein